MTKRRKKASTRRSTERVDGEALALELVRRGLRGVEILGFTAWGIEVHTNAADRQALRNRRDTRP